MNFEWNEEKNELLKLTRNLSFEEVIEEVKNGRFIGPEQNPNHQNQKRIIVKIKNYPCVVPFVITEDGNWFLKTIYPSRKMKGKI